MKKIFSIALCLSITLVKMSASPVSSESVEEDGTKLNLWIPGFLIKMAGEIAEEQADIDDELFNNIGSVTVCVRDGDKYTDKTDKKLLRKLNRLEKKNYENLISVNSEGSTVNIKIKENKKGEIKRFACLVDEADETFVYVKINCKLSPADLNQIVNNFQNDKREI